METYNDTTDTDEYVEHIDIVLNYRLARADVKCKLFVLTLKGPTMT
jgi:hypothetical protein